MYYLIAAWVLVSSNPQTPGDAETEDTRRLREAGIATSADGVLRFLRDVTAPPDVKKKAVELVRQLDDADFSIREEAAKKLVAIGKPAIPWLRQVQREGDAELKERAATCLAEIGAGVDERTVLAALRWLGQAKPAGAWKPTWEIGRAPLDDDGEFVWLTTLLALAKRGEQFDEGVLDGLADPDPDLRAAAALVVGKLGNAKERERVATLCKDDDPRVRFRAVQGLLAGRDLAGVPTLLDLIEHAPSEWASASVELLGRLADGNGPTTPLGTRDAERRACRDAWSKWWSDHADKLELDRLDVDGISPDLERRPLFAARQFFEAFLEGDAAKLKRSASETVMLIAERRELSHADLIRNGKAMQAKSPRLKLGFEVKEAKPLRDYLPSATDAEREFLEKVPRQGTSAVVYAIKADRIEIATGVLFVRCDGGKVRVVAYGEGGK